MALTYVFLLKNEQISFGYISHFDFRNFGDFNPELSVDTKFRYLREDCQRADTDRSFRFNHLPIEGSNQEVSPTLFLDEASTRMLNSKISCVWLSSVSSRSSIPWCSDSSKSSYGFWSAVQGINYCQSQTAPLNCRHLVIVYSLQLVLKRRLFQYKSTYLLGAYYTPGLEHLSQLLDSFIS